MGLRYFLLFLFSYLFSDKVKQMNAETALLFFKLKLLFIYLFYESFVLQFPLGLTIDLRHIDRFDGDERLLRLLVSAVNFKPSMLWLLKLQLWIEKVVAMSTRGTVVPSSTSQVNIYIIIKALLHALVEQATFSSSLKTFISVSSYLQHSLNLFLIFWRKFREYRYHKFLPLLQDSQESSLVSLFLSSFYLS